MTTVKLHETLFPIGGKNCDSWHRQIQTLFPDKRREEAGYTYLVEGPVARVRSVQATEFSREFVVGLEKGRSYAFRLRANATKKIPHKGGGKNSVRVPDRDWSGWLMRKQRGFLVRQVETSAVPKILANRKDSGKTMTFTGVDYVGLLECVDEVEMAHAVVHGVGPAKAYGFGMLQVEPI